MIDRAESVLYLLGFLDEYLNDDSIGEICINEPFRVWVERSGNWSSYETTVSNSEMLSICTAIASYNSTDVSEIRPIMSSILPGGQRIQVVIPPVADNISIVIRKPSVGVMDIYSYPVSYFGSDKVRDELISDVKEGRNIVVAGETGSGKTTMLKSLCAQIDSNQRIITIEDTMELFISQSHKNSVSMKYGDSGVTATSCLASCMRQKPDRIVMGEVRDGSAMDLISVIASGHGGSMSSLHAGSCDLAMERLSLMALQSEQGRALGYEAVSRLARLVVDKVVHVTNDSKGRRITEAKYI